MRPGLTLLALLLLTAAPDLAHGAWMQPAAPWRAKDFALVRHDGLYHLFYIRRNTTVPMDSSERDFGHAVSANLFHWQQLPPVLPARPEAWDRDHVWAPSLVQHDGVWYLFYTGVTNGPPQYNWWQRTGIATSTDLFQWNRLEAPVMSPADVPWSLADSTLAPAFRDPFVMPHPTIAGRWLMVYSAMPAESPDGMVVGLAASDDLTTWSDRGPLWITHHTRSYNTLTESPHLFEHDGTWFLMYTTNAGQPLTYATSPDPEAPEAAWTYRGRLATMLGVDTQAWYASEHLRVGLTDYLAFVAADHVEIYRMLWNGDTFTLVQPDLMHVRSLAFDRDSAAAGDTVALRIVTTGAVGRTLELEWLEHDANGLVDVLDPAPLGLPASIPIQADTMVVTWGARLWDDGFDGNDRLEYSVRAADHSEASGLLYVALAWRPPPPPPPPLPPAGEPPRPIRYDEEMFAARTPTVRPLRVAPFAAAQAFVVTLPAEGHARLELFDAAGRRVRTLADRTFGAGATVVGWDGRDAAGAAAAAGVYFVRVTSGDARHGARFTKLR